MIGALLGVVLAGVSSAIWWWQGERIKGWGGKARKAVAGVRDGILVCRIIMLAIRAGNL